MLFPLIDENPTRRWPIVTVGLIVVNSIIFLAMLGLDPVEHNLAFTRYGFVPARFTSAVQGGPAIDLDLRDLLGDSPEAREVLEQSGVETRVNLSANLSAVTTTIFTSMFLHAGFAHLLGNMWFLWIFGNNVEDRLGHVPYLLFYLFGGVCAALAHWAAVSGISALLPTVGASGAVAVTLGAYAVTYPRAHIHCVLFLIIIFMTVDLPAIAVLGIWIGWQVIEGIGALHLGMDAGVAWWAHIGGFLFGMAVMALLSRIIPDTTYSAILARERAYQFDPRQRDEFRF
ncbi:rhomboid family intramembrane serine protease [Bremerella sp. JC817]|uniref:rhomboid family intramembrane serine protease n=1 Tax=Bremerella sp. JC817 TaxID=3231756 RepID=UPI003459684B